MEFIIKDNMLTNSAFKCENCDKQAEYSLYDKKYCKEHYIKEKFGADTVHDYLDKHKIFHTHYTSDNHIILNRRDGQVMELCNLLGLELGEDYWFGIGVLGRIDFSNDMHIKEKKEV